MADPLVTEKTYVAALGYPSGLSFSDFERTTFQAPDNETAIAKAIEWARKHTTGIDPQTWLQVTLGGKGIHSEHIGKDYAPRL
jgi:hypothetical protein